MNNPIPTAVATFPAASPYTPDEATRAKNTKTHIVFVEMDTFVGPNIERRFAQNADKVLEMPGVKLLHRLSCQMGVQVVLMHHNNIFATVAEGIRQGAKLDGTAVSPQFSLKLTSHEDLAQAFGSSKKNMLFIGHTQLDTHSAKQDQVTTLRLEDADGFNGVPYDSALHEKIILNAVKKLKKPARLTS